MSKDIKDLVPDLQYKAERAIERMNNDARLKWYGVEKIAISETKRELSTQMAYYARGRMSICDTRKMYEAAGLYWLSEEEAKKMITWTLKSKHLEGKAIDLVPVMYGKLAWNAKIEIWERMGEIGKEYGLIWGGDWKEKDLPHFEIE